MAQSGQQCASCGRGILYVYSSYLSASGAFQFQYLQCDECGGKPPGNKVVTPADQIRRRRRPTLLSKRLNLKRR